MKHGTRYGYFNKGCRCMDCTKKFMQIRRRGLPAADDPRHGTANGYGNYGCRCQPCRDANTREVARQRAERRHLGLEPGDPRHGTSNGYCNWSCRCDDCRAAATRDSYTTTQRRRARAS